MNKAGFEIWRKNNPDKPWQDFKFGIDDITTVAPIFDIIKLNDISKNIISTYSGEKLYSCWLDWAEKNDSKLAEILKSDRQKFIGLCAMDRDGSPKPRKDIYNMKMMKEYFSYMFDSPAQFEIDPADHENANALLDAYLQSFEMPESNEDWFNHVKAVAAAVGYATDNKLYKQNPENFKGNIAKACEYIRVAITGRKNSPTLFNIIELLGESETKKRLLHRF